MVEDHNKLEQRDRTHTKNTHTYTVLTFNWKCLLSCARFQLKLALCVSVCACSPSAPSRAVQAYYLSRGLNGRPIKVVCRSLYHAIEITLCSSRHPFIMMVFSLSPLEWDSDQRSPSLFVTVTYHSICYSGFLAPVFFCYRISCFYYNVQLFTPVTTSLSSVSPLFLCSQHSKRISIISTTDHITF